MHCASCLQGQLPYETQQGCRDALSHNTDVFTLGLLAYKILLGPHLPLDMDWNSSMYHPWGAMQEQHYVAAQQRLARDLTRGYSRHPSTHALLQQLPHDCRHALARMCDPDPLSRAHLQEIASMAFIQQRMMQLAVYSGARDAAYAAARQQLIDLLQDVPGIHLAARPGRLSRHSISSSMPDLTQGHAAQVNETCKASYSSSCLQGLDSCGPPPGAFRRLPRGTNAAREAAAAAAAEALQHQATQQLQHQQNSNQQHQHTTGGLEQVASGFCNISAGQCHSSTGGAQDSLWSLCSGTVQQQVAADSRWSPQDQQQEGSSTNSMYKAPAGTAL